MYCTKKQILFDNKQNLLMPSQVLSPSPQVDRFHFCKKGKSHAQQPLNLICLDPICRNNPLICPACFSQHHKYHRTVPLSEFLTDYQGAIHRNHKHSTQKRINKEHDQIKKNLHQFRNNIIQKLNSYQESIEEYFRYLNNSLNTRQQLSRVLNIALDVKKIVHAHSSEQVQESLSFIINYSLFDPSNRLINVSSILKYDESRTLALMDKVVNENKKYQRDLEKEFKKLQFAKETLGKQSLRVQSIIKQFNQTKLPQVCSQPKKLIIDPKVFLQKETINSTINLHNLELQGTSQNFLVSKLHDLFTQQQQTKLANQNKIQEPLFVFSNVHKHEKLLIVDKDRQSTIKSNITALKPQYALICPSVDYQPKKEQNWSIKIKACRNFASSKNTIAVGLCQLSEIEGQKFEENPTKYMKNQYMLTSEGFLIKNGREDKCNFTFTTGDILDMKYDPYYKQLIIRKNNGRKVTVKIDDRSNESEQRSKLYPCVRLTYASDQVQILNHNVSCQH